MRGTLNIASGSSSKTVSISYGIAFKHTPFVITQNNTGFAGETAARDVNTTWFNFYWGASGSSSRTINATWIAFGRIDS